MILIIYIALLGLCIGSFLNVIIDRWSFDKSILGRSHCDFCKKKLSFFDLIPVLSFILLKGKCRYCKKPLSFYYIFVEIITSVLFVFTWIYFPTNIIFYKIISFAITSCLIVIFFADFKYHIIPDKILIWLGVFSIFFSFNNFLNNIFAGLIFYSIFYAIWFFTKGRGMGFGDVKYVFIIGILLGLKDGFIAIYLSFLFGGLFSIMLLIFKMRKMKSRIAFGPFLTLGIFVVIFLKNFIYPIFNKLFGL